MTCTGVEFSILPYTAGKGIRMDHGITFIFSELVGQIPAAI